ncbi:MAG: ATP-binding protein [Gammaproteobacteria bacterium]|nr:ATP-binding protein [Gammaproteobacteria bacterium]
MPSIRNKIRVSFYLFAATIAILSAASYSDLRYLQWRIESGISVYDFIDTVEESRRHEKNLFLYRLPRERDYALNSVKKAVQILSQDYEAFVALTDVSTTQQLQRSLELYAQQIQDYAPVVGRQRQQQQIRELGKVLITTVQGLRQAERQSLAISVSRSQWWLVIATTLITMLGIGAAHLISRAVVQPMSRLGAQLSHIVSNHLSPIIPSSADHEIVSMCEAMNHMQSELEEQNRQLLQSEKLASLGTLVSGVAHELNNPLSNISSSSQILMEDIQQGRNTDPMEWLQQIDDETQRAQRIVSTLLSFSREQHFVKQWTPLLPLVNDTLLLIGHEYHSRIEMDIATNVTLNVDRQRLQQVFVNLISNAIDAADEQVTIQIRARRIDRGEFQSPEQVVYGRRVCPLKDNKMILIEIEDNGSGISAEILPRIFDPFFTTKEVGHGSGLGLYVSEEIIEMHQGCIGVSSQLSKGTHFYIGLPIDEESDNADE